jgi:hypothetical protein
MKLFLTLKHWQLFILLVGVPFIAEILLMGVVIASSDPRIAFYFFPLIMILSVGPFTAWFYSLGTNLFKRVPLTVKMSLTRFKVFLFFQVAYILFLTVFMAGLFSNLSPEGKINPAIFSFIFPLHIFAMFCIFYCLYFNAKALKAIELKRPVTFGDYAGEFFLLWFFPIGIWILQPRINRLINSTPEEPVDSLFEGFQG